MEYNTPYRKEREEYKKLIREYQKSGLLPKGEISFQKLNDLISIDKKYMSYLVEKRESSAIGKYHWQKLINVLDEISCELRDVLSDYRILDISIRTFDRFRKKIDETNIEAVALFISQNKEKPDYEIFEGVEKILDELQKRE